MRENSSTGSARALARHLDGFSCEVNIFVVCSRSDQHGIAVLRRVDPILDGRRIAGNIDDLLSNGWFKNEQEQWKRRKRQSPDLK